jgi:hypothetical protein
MNEEPKEPYVYQPYGMESENWNNKLIYGVAGISSATIIKGISRKLATKIVEWLKEEVSHE